MNATNYCSDFIDDAKNLQSLSAITSENLAHAKDAVKFRLPDNGIILDIVNPNNISVNNIKSRVPDVIGFVRLPFDKVALEFSMLNEDNPSQASKIIVLASNTDNGIEFNSLMKVKHNNNSIWVELRRRGVIFPDCSIKVRSRHDDKATVSDGESNIIVYNSYVLLSMIAALQCSNVTARDIPASNLLNKKRIKKGKQPLFDYKVLTIDTKADAKQQKGGIGTGNTKRVHLRRGHIRRLPDKTVWVNPCVVGDKSKGMVTKDYKVK